MTKETFIKELDKILKRETLIEELEQIKSEIYDIPNWVKPQMIKNDMVKLLDKHIDKLKGENNVAKSNV